MKMVQENVVVYLGPNKFPSRQSELKLEKPKKELDIVNSKLTVKDQAVDLECTLSTPLHLHHALHRRALAMDLVGVCTYSVMMRYNEFLMSHLSVDPPPGYARPTIHQILEADRAAWLKVAEKLPRGVKRTAGGNLPMDTEWPLVQTDPRVCFHLLPLPASSASAAQGTKRTNDDGDASPPPPGKFQKWQRGGGKGGGKKGGKTKTPRSLPIELKGKWSTTKRGVPLCWDFNTGGCSLAPAGGRCPRGMHLCAEPNCQKPHPLPEHPSK